MSISGFDSRVGTILPYSNRQRVYPSSRINMVPLILTVGTVLANLGGMAATIQSCPKIFSKPTDYANLGALAILVGGMPVSVIAYGTDLILLAKG